MKILVMSYCWWRTIVFGPLINVSWIVPTHFTRVLTDNARVKIHDGVVHTLANVQHILYLKENLISLNTLDRNGYRYFAKCGVLKVNKGALIAMKAKKASRLYVLQGSIDVGATTTSINLSKRSLVRQ